MLEVEGERAKRRMAVRSPERLPVPNWAQVNETGKARQIVADKLGAGKNKVTQAAAVVQASARGMAERMGVELILSTLRPVARHPSTSLPALPAIVPTSLSV